MVIVRNLRARRYLLRLRPDGSARVTIPRGGSTDVARRFAERNIPWIERTLLKSPKRPTRPQVWTVGSEIFFRGELVRIESMANGSGGQVRVGTEVLALKEPSANLRPAMVRHFWKMAARELPPRVLKHASEHQLTVRRIMVRNQRTRWGSCSRRGTISLNWRIIQAPPFVRDYLILHELMHLRQMNHSPRFWREVERACPDYKTAERWLKQHSSLLV